MPGLIADITALAQSRAIESSVGGIQNAIQKIKLDRVDIIERRFKDLQQTFGLSIEQAAAFGENIDNLAEKLGTGGDAVQALIIGMKSLTGIFASNKSFGQAKTATAAYEDVLIKTSKTLRMHLGLTSDLANKYMELYDDSNVGGMDKQLAYHVNITKAIEDQIGGIEITKDVIQDLASLTADIALHYNKYPADLELAVIKAKQLGINMAQLNTTGQGLLNIESSIGQEMEYQLLSGRRLVDNQGNSLTNAYRMATIQGKANDQAKIMHEILKREGKTLRTNAFARKQMSELLNMDESTLAKMLKKEEILEKLDPTGQLMGLTGKDLEQKLATMGASATEIADVMASEDVRSTDQKLVELLDIMTTKGIKAMITGYGTTYANSAVSSSNAQIDLSKEAGKQAFSFYKTAAPGTLIAAVTQIAGETTTTALKTFFGSVINVGVGGQKVSKTNPLPVITDVDADAGDFYSGPGGGRVLLGPHGAMSIDNNDVVMGGTDLFKGNASNSSGDVMQMAAAIVAAINNQTRELKSDPVFGRGLSNSYYG